MASKLSVLVLAALAISNVGARLEAQSFADPCRQVEPLDAKVFEWVGNWHVVDEEGRAVGKSSVEPVAGGCALETSLARTDGSREFGLIFLDRSDNTWYQRWISSRGHSALIELSLIRDGISAQGTIDGAGGGPMLMQSVISPRVGGGFTQKVEISVDGGKTYTDSGATHYVPPGGAGTSLAPPGPAADTTPSKPAPMPSPQKPATEKPQAAKPKTPKSTAPTPPKDNAPELNRDGKVKVRSKRKAEAPIPETAMESPMTLEFELGPLADLPPGAGWRTTELSPYVADQVNIPRVTAQRRQRRGKTEIELVINLRTRTGQSKVDLDVALLSDDRELASERLKGIALGKLIRAHHPVDGMPQTVRLAIDAKTFDSIFADGARPSVRLTVSVR